jgi:hypothetical protein
MYIMAVVIGIARAAMTAWITIAMAQWITLMEAAELVS